MTKNPSRRGRPAFKPTPALRTKVEQLVSCGMTAIEVGRAIGCNDDTLRKHFAEELAGGVAKKRAEAIGLLWKSAKKGNVSAQKKLEEMTGRTLAEQSFVGDRDQPKAAKSAPIGKKEERQANADRSASEGVYAVPSAPKLAVDNTR